jgi:peroxiredoxin
MIWVEPGLDDNTDGDPFQVSDADTMLKWLEQQSKG